MSQVTLPKRRENYASLLFIALVLSLAIFVTFQIYIQREPERIQGVLLADLNQQTAHGQKLFSDNCTKCHGDQGEGDIGPALNSKKFLKSTGDDVIASIIGSGVPGSAMPSWSQQHGGPLTDDQIQDLVVFIRHWEATAQDVAKAQPTPDAAEGAVLFSTTCFACHGTNGEGTNIAPALNYQQLLTTFDDNWFRQTIAQGRPNRGMPTWGNVFSPSQIDSIVAYIRSWQATAPSVVSVPAGADPVKGSAIFSATCVVCHGTDAMGTSRAPSLNSQQFRNSHSAADLVNIITQGRIQKGMPAWGRVLSPTEIGNVAAYLESLSGKSSAFAATLGTAAPVPTVSSATAQPTPTSVAVAAPSDAQIGKLLFQSKGCVKCHGSQGEGLVGPRLIGNKLTHDAIVKQVRTPPPGLMPPFTTSQVSDAELERIIAFILSIGKQ